MHSQNPYRSGLLLLTVFASLENNSLSGMEVEFLSDLIGEEQSQEPFAISIDGTVIVGKNHTSDNLFIWKGESYTEIPDGTLTNYESVYYKPVLSGDGETVFLSAKSQTGDSVILKWLGNSVTEHFVSSPEIRITAASHDGSVVVGFQDGEAMRLENGITRKLGILGKQLSIAEAVSADGSTIAGNARSSSGVDTAFVWKDDSMTALPVPASTVESRTKGISADGTIITGSRKIGGGWETPVIWINDTMVDLPFPLGAVEGWAESVTDDNRMVLGYAADPSGYAAVIWFNDSGWSAMYLQPYLESLGADFRGYTIFVHYISGDGKTITGRIDKNRPATTWRFSLAAPSAMYGPYTVRPDGFCDTTPWMGWLWVGDDPWVWSFSLNQWLFCPGERVSESGGWVYLPK